MQKTVLVLALALAIGSASGAMAQAYDPEVGSGNIVNQGGAPAATWTPSHVRLSPVAASSYASAGIMPFGPAAAEERLFQQAKGATLD